MATQTLSIRALTDPDSPAGRAARAIYDEAFEPDERVPWERLWKWHVKPSADFRSVFWTLHASSGPHPDPSPKYGGEDRSPYPHPSPKYGGAPLRGGQARDRGEGRTAGPVIGLFVFGCFRPPILGPRMGPALGYLAYLAIRPDQRGRGHGEWLFRRGLAEIERIARRGAGAPPRVTFWEVRRPEDSPTPEERVRRERRIRFYERLGGRILPLDYTCPPIADGQPSVRYTVMASTDPPAAAIDRAAALDIALTGLIEANGAQPGDAYVQAALASVDRHWPAPGGRLG